jgi:23S rRNA maturation mini-RNase III
MLYTDLGAFYVQNSVQHQSCHNSNGIVGYQHSNLYDVLVKTITATQQSMSPHSTNNNREQNPSKEKRAIYMSQLRGSIDSEYRRIERENNARAMRKKRSENPLYREHERRQNRAHMAKMRRDNPQYRQREHVRNRHRMALKRGSLSQTAPSTSTTETNETSLTTTTTTTSTHGPPTIAESMINSIYQTLENNLQSSHISFVPYQPSSSFRPIFEYHHHRRTNNKLRSECELLQQVDEYCRQQHDAGSGSDSNSRGTTGSTLSSC